MSSETFRLPADWSKDLGITVLDADGWRADGTPWGFRITEEEFRQRAAMSTMREDPTPAPLDPARVKAGDTVTLEASGGRRVTAPVSERTLPERTKGTWFLDVFYDDDSPQSFSAVHWTLTDHQPAPEPEPEESDFHRGFRLGYDNGYTNGLAMASADDSGETSEDSPEPEPEWEPGTVAVVVQGGDPGAGVDDHEFRAALQSDGTWVGLAGEAATAAPVSVRPLVVIDPAAVDAILDDARNGSPGVYDIYRTAYVRLGIEAS